MTEDEVFAKGYDLGKQEAEQQQASEIEWLRKENKRLRDRVKLLEMWLEGEAYCPCSMGVKECTEGCTFAKEDPKANKWMLVVRAVLYGGCPCTTKKR